MSLIESAPCFWKALGVGRDRCGVICQYCFIPDAGTSAQKEALLKGFVPSNLLKEIMVDIFRDAVLIRKRMRKLPGQYSRKRLPVRGKKISGQRKDLLSCSGIRITINSIINSSFFAKQVIVEHHLLYGVQTIFPFFFHSIMIAQRCSEIITTSIWTSMYMCGQPNIIWR